jgi:hypothetical protein
MPFVTFRACYFAARYGVPLNATTRFEQSLRNALYLRAQEEPDLLHQLTTMVSFLLMDL